MQGATRLVFFLFMLMLVWLPFPYGSNRVWAWSLMEVLVFSMIMGLMLIRAFGSHRIPESVKRAKWIMFIGFMWAILPIFQIIPLPVGFIEVFSPKTLELKPPMPGVTHLAMSLDVERSIEELLKNFAYLSLFFLTLYTCYSVERQRTLLISISIVTTLVAIWVVSGTAIELITTGRYEPATGSFINKNHFAAFLNIGIAAAVGIILSAGLAEKRSENLQTPFSFALARLMDWRWHMVVYLGIIIFALVLSMSRGAWMALVSSMIVVFIFVRSSQHYQDWHFSTFNMLLAIVGMTMVLAGGQIIIDRLGEIGPDSIGRQSIWLTSLHIFKDFPFFGTGAGNFQYVYPIYDNGVVKDYVDHAHNDYIQLLVEQGPIGVLLAGLMAYSCIKQGIKGVRANHSMTRSAFAAGSLVGCFAMLIHGLVDFNFHIPSNAAYFFVFLAMAWISGQPSHIEVKQKHRRSLDRRARRAGRRSLAT
jgi:putative inorganic carbon (HCO3(-)) transporter